MIKIYHNPRCRKSRETLEIIKDSGTNPEVIEYLKSPPSVKELDDLLKKMGKRPEEIVRKGEDIYKMKFSNKILTREEWLNALVKYPKLMERPIVVKGNQAILGRPPENVKAIL